ncbi:hypothetical protein AMK59_6874, partial [Oryctes borbonicus]
MLSAFAVYKTKPDSKNNPKQKLQQQSITIKKKRSKRKHRNIINGIAKTSNVLHEANISPKKQIKKKLNVSQEMEIDNDVPVSQLPRRKEVKDIHVSPLPTKKEFSTKIQKKSKQKIKQVSNKPINIDTKVLKRPLDLLSYLLAPIDVSEFFNTYWESKPLHIVRNKEDYFKNIFSSQQLDTILRNNLLYYTRNVDVVTYENDERQTHNPEGRAIPANVWDYYMNGCSVRIMNPHTYNHKVRDMLSTLQEYFGSMVGANVYLTPSGSQGFAPHYDDIEAFVIQLEGHKNWKLYAPRTNAEMLPRYSSQNLPRNELQAPIKELTLKAGDLLYFPRGFIHEASTDKDAHSLHITVSVYQHTAYVDLLEKLLPIALKNASENDVDFRKGLPLNYLKHVGVVNSAKNTSERKEIFSKVKELMHKMVDYALVDAAADQLGRKFMYEALPPHLSSAEKERSSKEDGDRMENGVVTNIASFSPDTMVRFARYHSQRLVVEESGVVIYYCTENANVYHGEEEQSLELDNTLIDTVTALQNIYPQYISIEDLPCNDEIKKIQAISDLW